jgi:hypothetical protein
MQAAERDREFVADLAAEVELLGVAHARQRCLKRNSLNGIEKIGFVLPNRQMPNGQMSLSDPRVGKAEWSTTGARRLHDGRFGGPRKST